MDSKVYNLKKTAELYARTPGMEAVLLGRVSENIFQNMTSHKAFYLNILCSNRGKKTPQPSKCTQKCFIKHYFSYCSGSNYCQSSIFNFFSVTF